MQHSIFRFFLTGTAIIIFASCDFKYGVHKMEPLVRHEVRNNTLLEAIDQELSASPQDGSLLKRKVNILESANWPKGSGKALEQALKALPEDGELHYQKGHYHFSRDELGEALQSLTVAGNLGYLTADYFLLFARALLRSGQAEEAFRQVNRFQHLDPDNYRSYYLKGRIFFEQGDTLKALEAYDRAFSMEKNDDALNIQLLDLYLAGGDTSNFNRTVGEISRSDVGWLLKVALLKQNYGLSYEAIKDFRRITEQDPYFIAAWNYLADAYYRLQRYDLAIRNSQYITRLDSANLQARLVRARSFNNSYAYSEAVEEYRKILAIDSTHNEALEELNSVNRKVAYLRRLREEKERESIPEFDFTPKKKKEINSNN